MSHFQRIAPAQFVVALGIWLMAKGFAYDVLSGGKSPIPAELYGDVVYAIPALTWAYGQEALAVLAMLGSGLTYVIEDWTEYQPPQGLGRVLAAMAAAGWISLTCLCAFFAAWATVAPKGSLLLWAGTGTTAITLYFSISAMRHVIWGQK